MSSSSPGTDRRPPASTASVSDSAPSSAQSVILGTAGHIDHGKTSLVRRLTGIETDRLPEEKARGISIELGFAHFRAGGFEFEVVDVPGHERFVHNMVAGATGIDLALLVVAADDGVMPQTLEHLEIMELLGISAGVVAITKTDLVDPDLVELVRLEIAERVQGTFLEGAPVVPVSSVTGAGCQALVEALVDTACRHPPHRPGSLLRMPIDRVFTVPGHGTVITGTVISGSVNTGDTLELLPAQIPVRVRTVQHHGQTASAGGRSQRCAVNLASIKASEIVRGNEIATPDYLSPALRLLVRLRCLTSSPVFFKDRVVHRLHIGTDEVSARIIVKGNPIGPGQTGFAELRLDRPVAAGWGQRFILRRPSPAITVGGGTVLDPGFSPRRRIASLQEAAQARESSNPFERLDAFLADLDQTPASSLEAAWRVGVEPEAYSRLVGQLHECGHLVRLAGEERFVHRRRLENLAESMLARMRAEVLRRQPRRSLARAVLLATCQKLAAPELLEIAFQRLMAQKRLVAVGDHFGPADLQVQLSKAQTALRQAILQRIEAAGLTPPTDKELAVELSARPDAVQSIMILLIEDGLIVPVGSGLHYAPAALEQAREICRAVLALGPATVSQLREAWGVSRKFGLPLCEYFDAQGLTLRAGDLRRLVEPEGGTAGARG